MPKFKNHRSFIILTLLTMLTVIFLKKQTLQSHHVERSVIVKPENISDMSQDHADLISLIRDKYLVTPAGPAEKLNFVRKVYRSPVLKVVHKILRNKTDGYFLECGAFDGEFLSNTIELEHYFNWQGVLVEADPKYVERLLGKRRKAWVAPVCLSPEPHAIKTRMVRHQTGDALSHIPEFHPFKPSLDNYVFYEVQCFPLYSIVVAALNRTEIDYLSLDVEGAEYWILQTIPFDKLKIKVISLEVNFGERLQNITRFLQSKGYVYQTRITASHTQDIVLAHQSVL